jgi:formylglycine-generating enzyme required for sulfatase activity
MADIFISYAKKDRSRVEPLAKALEDQGWSVFWDRAIPGGKTWDEVIEEELDTAKCVVVVWSNISKSSRWVRAEAEEGLKRGILVPVSIEDTNIPLLFRPIQSVRLIHWQEDPNHPQFEKLISDLSPILGPSPRKVKEAEQLCAEEEKRRKEQELKRKTEDERERRELRAKVKTDKPEPDEKATIESVAYTSRKRVNALKFGAVVGVILLIIVSIWWFISKPQKVITNSIGMNFVLIPSGTFTMGSQLSPEEVVRRYRGKVKFFKDEQPPHPVEITKPFYLQTTEVSQGQWKSVIGDNPSGFKDCGDDCPVEDVSWNDAQKFINKLNQMEGTKKYRLPTEAEWEYACRAGTETSYSFGNDVKKLGEYAWYTENSKDQTHPVGKKKPNAWGLYDMHGNVGEWVQDWYGDYSFKSVADPEGPDNGMYRVFRGGSCYSWAWGLRSAHRGRRGPDGRYGPFFGFRVARYF